MTAVDVAGLRRLLEEATERPWEWTDAEHRGVDGGTWRWPLISTEDKEPESFQAVADTGYDRPQANAELIVAAVNALPELLDRLEKLEEVAEAMRARPCEHVLDDLRLYHWNRGIKTCSEQFPNRPPEKQAELFCWRCLALARLDEEGECGKRWPIPR